MFIDESEAADELQRLTRELENFQDIAQQLVPLPGEVPTLEGFDIWGGSLQMSGSVGGDHITYIDFKTRFDLKARIERARAEGPHGCRREPGTLPAQGRRRAHRRRRPSDDRCPAGGHAAPGVSARRDLRTGSLRADHATAVREPQHALLSVLRHEQVRVAHLRRDLRRREVSLSVGGTAVPVRVLEPARSVHGGQPAPLPLVPSARDAAVVQRDRSQHDAEPARLQGTLRDERVDADGPRATSC